MEFLRTQTNPAETALIRSGQLDFLVRKDFQAIIQEAQTEETQHIILDLSKMSFMDCATIGILLKSKQALTKAHIALSHCTR